MWYKIAFAAGAGFLGKYYRDYCMSVDAPVLRNTVEKQETSSKEMVVLSHNVNHEIWRGGMSRKRLDYIFSLIQNMDPQPDIITLQEVYRSVAPFVQDILGDSVKEFVEYLKEYNCAFGHSGGMWYFGLELGKLTFSKYSILCAEKKQLEGSYFRSILWTKLDTPAVPTNVYNVHTTGISSQLREILSYIKATSGEGERVIIAGDINQEISDGAAGRQIFESEGFKISDVGPTALIGMSLEAARYWRSIDMIAIKDRYKAPTAVFDRVLDQFCPNARVWPSDHAGIRARLPYADVS